MRISCSFTLVVLLLIACVEPVDLPVLKKSDVLVVDGMITDQEGTHSVKLFYTSALNENVDDAVAVTGASVSILDDQENVMNLVEKEGGVYTTPENSHGTIGVSYKLRIVLADGGVYESTPAKMVPAGTLDAVDHQFRENVINEYDISKPQDAIYLFLDGSAAEESNLLRWRWKATYYVETFPQLATKVEDGQIVAAPLECSGYRGTGGTKIEYVKPCTCCECWPVLHGDGAFLSQPENVGDRTFIHEYIGRVAFKTEYFFPKLVVEIDQLSVSEDVHRFWGLVKVQTESAGNIFQPNIVKVIGNMKRLDKPEENVFGVFSVSAVVSTRYTIHDYDIPRPIYLPDTIITDCRSYFKASNQRPPFW
jgi:hypothetical protein